MAERQTATTFPAPPPFYKHFTRENARLLKARDNGDGKSTGLENGEGGAEKRALQYLIPPAIPEDGKWRSFGIEHDVNAVEPTLGDSGIEQLFPGHPSVKLAPQPYLIAMARSLLTTFLTTTAVLSKDPTLYAKKVEDLRTIAINMHHLINLYRPHQARQGLIEILEGRLADLRGEISAIEKARESLKTLTSTLKEQEGLASSGMDVSQPEAGTEPIDSRFAEVSSLWDMLGEMENSTTQELPLELDTS